jgi:hypothetical protein
MRKTIPAPRKLKDFLVSARGRAYMRAINGDGCQQWETSEVSTVELP